MAHTFDFCRRAGSNGDHQAHLHARLKPTRLIAGASVNPAMHDHYWLYNAPSTADSVAWSEDNVIAVANRHCVTLLDPNQLDGPRCVGGRRGGRGHPHAWMIACLSGAPREGSPVCAADHGLGGGAPMHR